MIEEKIARAIAKIELEVEYYQKFGLRTINEEKKKRKLNEKTTRVFSATRKELVNFKKLLNSAHREFQTKIIRDYIQSTEDKARQTGNISPDLLNWISWARKKADWYDPQIENEMNC